MPTKKPQVSSRKTIHRLCVSGILLRVFRGMRTKGITIESVGHYEAGLEYRALRERGHVSPCSGRPRINHRSIIYWS